MFCPSKQSLHVHSHLLSISTSAIAKITPWQIYGQFTDWWTVAKGQLKHLLRTAHTCSWSLLLFALFTNIMLSFCIVTCTCMCTIKHFFFCNNNIATQETKVSYMYCTGLYLPIMPSPLQKPLTPLPRKSLQRCLTVSSYYFCTIKINWLLDSLKRDPGLRNHLLSDKN